MILYGVETSKKEIESLRGFIPSTEGAELLGKIIVSLEKEGFKLLRDRNSGVEVLRYAQGFLDALGRFEATARAMLAVDLERAEEMDDDIEIDEEVADVSY